MRPELVHEAGDLRWVGLGLLTVSGLQAVEDLGTGQRVQPPQAHRSPSRLGATRAAQSENARSFGRPASDHWL
jgi:hypothetical protein